MPASPRLFLPPSNVTGRLQGLARLVTLLPDDFVRLHRSYVARLSEVERLRAHEDTRYDVVLDDDTTLPVGRTRVEQIREQIRERLL